MNISTRISFAECSARQRIALLFDEGSFTEWLPPAARVMSPHLAQLCVPAAFDDGVAIGSVRLDGHCVFIAAQEGEFMGGWRRRGARGQAGGSVQARPGRPPRGASRWKAHAQQQAHWDRQRQHPLAHRHMGIT